MQMDERLDALLAVLSEETYLNVESIAKKLRLVRERSGCR